ncbi:Zn-dependent peptidase ImmA (M78 family)/DNA-binding XRE family transcriptional regulator [Variovorax sp. TBS-050B]|uniref:helix-turn-helix domain-containing protein n=1 Tax=Variovorax sp. TBS-050B TaxID=2940551 RepID=UPI002476C492|nr:XRE family transcriptional regulator [Variovorax sp. TBS-050B]MDH6592523.1 Zn-dependent peptidase ImmA (M78 family)/DNA-binding XRE family transcriptional regulator [Variovorax sp. TBS-050B]
MATQALINPALLRWARDRAGLSLEDAAQTANVKSAQLASWEAGESRPTFRQAQHLAHALHAPFGYLFLDAPPQETLPLPDLRTVAGRPAEPPSLNLLDTVRIALQRQAWYLEYRQDHELDSLPFVGRFNTSARIEDVAADIRRELKVDIETGQRTWEVYFRDLVQAAERAGVLIMRSGVVGNNTRRKLEVSEFRGFAISDAQAPVVFINSADAPAARLFTLLHELAHIWIGSSGVSHVSPADARHEEVFCNAVAGEFLAPEHTFRAHWQLAPEEFDSRIAELAARFHVSRFVIMRRALDLGLIDRAIYNDRYFAMLAAFRNQENAGGSFYRNAEFKNSARFAQAVVTEALSGRLLLRDAGRLLGIQPDKIRKFAEQLGS